MRKIGVRDVMSVHTFVDVLDDATIDASIDQHATCMAGPARTLPSEDPERVETMRGRSRCHGPDLDAARVILATAIMNRFGEVLSLAKKPERRAFVGPYLFAPHPPAARPLLCLRSRHAMSRSRSFASRVWGAASVLLHRYPAGSCSSACSSGWRGEAKGLATVTPPQVKPA